MIVAYLCFCAVFVIAWMTKRYLRQRQMLRRARMLKEKYRTRMKANRMMPFDKQERQSIDGYAKDRLMNDMEELYEE